MSSGIYKITCTITNKFYIGSSKDLKVRLRSHKSCLRSSTHKNKYLQQDWIEHTEQNFVFDIIELTSSDPITLFKIEQTWLDKTKCYEREIGYNISKIACGPMKERDIDEAIFRIKNIAEKYKTLENIHKLNQSSDLYLRWVQSMRSIKKRTLGSTWDSILDETATEVGLNNLFDVIDHEKIAITRLYEIINRYQTLDNLPTKDRNKSDHYWIRTKQKGKKGVKGKSWYPILDEIAKEHGFEGMFDKKREKRKHKEKLHAIKRLNEIIDKYKTLDNLPNKFNKNKDETKDFEWIGCKRQAKKGNGLHAWYRELDEIAEVRGFGGMFEEKKVRKTQKAVARFKHIIETYKSIEYLPSTNDSNIPKNKDAKWINQMRHGKSNKFGKTWYPILDEIAKENGFTGIFDFPLSELKKKNLAGAF